MVFRMMRCLFRLVIAAIRNSRDRYSKLYEDKCNFLGLFDDKVPKDKWERACEKVAASLQ